MSQTTSAMLSELREEAVTIRRVLDLPRAAGKTQTPSPSRLTRDLVGQSCPSCVSVSSMREARTP
jgi:hypothetical protein